ncbi:hypothetical protein A3A48_00780 [Candidatus Curtissbacteria bacterium RIFCSPLOWO2_01_FULL_37_9]|uniref:Uncharacterized protein n=1 Tax=Candidatus Curtissbacteria bacterium RIFCSPLOWO2_01_FULL_37_9 TaxID=1797724 RepID=A0A1F5GUT9_9BACT|nr:MAG: hypothetical protein A3A48_00780 [Candidatus Curtissbacteria bacterium RIFCSPLOWO2_01_FULL_37_9]
MSDKNVINVPPQKLLRLLPKLQAHSIKIEDGGEVPTVTDILDQFMTQSTILGYREKPIKIENSPQSTVKFLDVNICSMETRDIALLHKLHTKTQQI